MQPESAVTFHGHSVGLCLVAAVLLQLFLTSSGQVATRITFHFEEEQRPGAYVGDVAVESGLKAMSPQEFSQLQFVLHDSEFFEVDIQSGELTSKVRIDREERCSGTPTCELNAFVTVYKGQPGEQDYDLFKYVTVIVIVDDVNDKSPEFPSENVNLSIPEGNKVDDVLRTSAAVDADSGDNSVKQYSFQDPTDTFTLTVHKNPDGSSYLGIVIKEVLDREARDFYQVIVIARDGGRPQRSGSVTINITVSDVNDNSPVWAQPSYNESVLENVDLHVPIVKLVATDADSGRNAEISYRFSSQVSDTVRQKLYVDEQTGEILAQSTIDYEEQKLYQFAVEAVDHGTPEFSTRVGVTLNVIDMNDNAPQISINMSPKGTDISEGQEAGLFVAQVSVHDMDGGINSVVLCDMNDAHFSLEKFYNYESNVYKVILAKPLDHEQASSHRVTITCTDSGTPALSNSTTFVVNVLDKNDNHPSFTKQIYYGDVVENQPGVHEVVTVLAHDWDSGDFGKITYSLEDGFTDLFRINSVTGVVEILRAVDREDTPKFEFHVVARDHSPEQLSASALVVVDVADENDEAPYFPKPIYFGDVLENQPAGTRVGNVTAIDPDSGMNAEFLYSIVDLGPDYTNFTINPLNGVILSTAVFDREEKDQYHIVIKVTDTNRPEFTSSCNFTIRVLDDNDHAPVIHTSTVENSTIVVDYNAPVGSVITTVLAYDDDESSSPNSQIAFFIQTGDPDELFNLNRYNGKLSLARIITSRDIKTYNLVLKVQDGGDPPRFDTKRLNVKINGTIPEGSSSGGLDQNILIVIILVGVTIVLGLAILATICLIKRIDRERRQNRAHQKISEEKMYQLKQQEIFTNMSSVDGLEDSNSNNLSKKGKKEVSFSLDEESDSHNTSAGSGHPLTSFRTAGDKGEERTPGRPCGSSSQAQANGGMNIPVGQGEKSSNIRRSPRDEECHLIEILKKSAEDALSESSGETDPSDSGRGGSEDDSSHRSSGLDREHKNNINNNNNSNSGSNSNIYPQVFYRNGGSPTRDQLEQEQASLHPPNRGSGRRGQSPLKGRSHRSTPPGIVACQQPSPRNSFSSDIDSDISGSRASQSRSDSDYSSNQILPAFHRGNSRERISPSSTQMMPFRAHEQNPSRRLMTRDSPNRLTAPQHSNNALLRSFHGQPSNHFNSSRPSIQSHSMERLHQPSPDRWSYTAPERPHGLSDRSDRTYRSTERAYPPHDRWAGHRNYPDDDDRTTTSGSYTINPDELRQEIDELILQDSIV